MVAGVAAGWFADLRDAASRTVRVADEPIRPRQDVAELYDQGYRAYRRLFDAVEATAS